MHTCMHTVEYTHYHTIIWCNGTPYINASNGEASLQPLKLNTCVVQDKCSKGKEIDTLHYTTLYLTPHSP